MLKLMPVGESQARVCAILAGDKEEAIYRATEEYGGQWKVMSVGETLKEIRELVEDSPTKSILLNI